MLKDIIKKENIKFTDIKLGWKDAIELSANQLIKDGIINEGYVESMISNVEKYGAYIDLGKGIAISHAKDYDNVNEVGISILKMNIPTLILDQEDHKVDTIITIACKDNKSHLTYLAEIARLLSDEKLFKEFHEATTVEHVYNVIHGNDLSIKFATVCGESLVSSFMIKENISNLLSYWGIREKVEIYIYNLEECKNQENIDVWFVSRDFANLDLKNLVVLDSILDRKELEGKLKEVCIKYNLL